MVRSSGRLGLLTRLKLAVHGSVNADLAEHFPQLFKAYSAGAKQARRAYAKVNYGGLKSHAAIAAVHYGLHHAVNIMAHMLGGGRTGLARYIGTGGCDGNARQLDYTQCRGMVGAAHAHGIHARSYPFGHTGFLFENHGKRTRPEFFCQRVCLFGYITAPLIKSLRSVNVDNQRVILRSALDFEYSRHRLVYEGSCAEPVDRFGRNSHQTAAAYYVSRALKGILAAGVFYRKIFSIQFQLSSLIRSFSAWSAVIRASTISSMSPFIIASIL